MYISSLPLEFFMLLKRENFLMKIMKLNYAYVKFFYMKNQEIKISSLQYILNSENEFYQFPKQIMIVVTLQ